VAGRELAFGSVTPARRRRVALGLARLLRCLRAVSPLLVLLLLQAALEVELLEARCLLAGSEGAGAGDAKDLARDVVGRDAASGDGEDLPLARVCRAECPHRCVVSAADDAVCFLLESRLVDETDLLADLPTVLADFDAVVALCCHLSQAHCTGRTCVS